MTEYESAINTLSRAFDKFKKRIGKILVSSFSDRPTRMYYRRYARHGKKGRG